MVRGLLFDLDGTLVSTRKANFLAYREAFAEVGHILSAEVFDRTWGRDSRSFVPELIPGIGEDQAAELRARKSVLYERYLDETIANVALIDFLKVVGPSHRTAIVTTAKVTNGRQILVRHGLESLFDVQIFGDAVSRSKPDPEGYHKALAELGIKPDEGLAFEDSAPGRAAALAAGLHVVSVPEFG